jgi:hypothetical protein
MNASRENSWTEQGEALLALLSVSRFPCSGKATLIYMYRPVGAGYDTGRSKRPREDVNPNFRCDL